MATIDENVTIHVEADTVAGTFVAPDTLMPGVLFVHGWGGSQAQYLARAHAVASLGCICLTFDLRGHADTRVQYETVSRDSNLKDVLAAYDTLLQRRRVDPEAIAVIGSSYGGYLAAILTSLRKVKWLGLRAPALYLDSGWEMPKLQLHKSQDLLGYRSRRLAAAENRALNACENFAGDVLLVESEHDLVIPQAVLSNYREACAHSHSLTYRCLPGADHGLTGDDDQRAYSTLLTTWMTEMLAAMHSDVAAGPSVAASDAARPEAPPLVA